ncbi:MAG: hypothetical protein HPY74_01110 [Firmicutes bacterium]|nr:hypothetical protein [Bacillota bacterium]
MGRIRIKSPYFGEGKWVKANLHVHPTPVSEDTGYFGDRIIIEYIKAGYDVVSLTGWGNVYLCSNSGDEKNGMQNIVLVPGFEKKADMPMVVLNSMKTGVDRFDHEENEKENETNNKEHEADNSGKDSNRGKDIQKAQEFIDSQNKAGGLVFFVQPMELSGLQEKLEYLKNLDGYVGIEILNGNIAFGNGSKIDKEQGKKFREYCSSGIEIALWDSLLDSGKKIWGFGNDGLQKWGEFNSVFNLVKLRGGRSISPGGVINALTKGSFAVSTGVRIKDIAVDEDKNTISLMVDNKFENKTYIAYGKERRILKMCCTKEDVFSYSPEGNEGYVRMQVIYESGKTLLTQPFFIE